MEEKVVVGKLKVRTTLVMATTLVVTSTRVLVTTLVEGSQLVAAVNQAVVEGLLPL